MADWQDRVYHGDCLEVIRKYGHEMTGKIRLIYIDPPFLSQTDYTLKQRTKGEKNAAGTLTEKSTYTDKWSGGIEEYLDFLRVRIEAMRNLLRDDGSLWVHVDWHGSHYVKVMLDRIFGYSNFVNEIVWRRTNSPKVQSKGFGTQHDVILLYAKDSSKFRIKTVYRDHDEKSLRPYSYSDERGRFRLIEIEAQGIQRTEKRKQFTWRGRTAPYLYRRETLDEWWEQGLIYESKNGRYTKKQYLADIKGLPVSDLWLDIPPVQGVSREYTGFSTQKPEALLRRVIESGSDSGDIVVDFFAGSGTTAVVAHQTDRRWALCDESPQAIKTIQKRLQALGDDIRYELVKV
ncbi:MAG: site-specific DNA-methyltransferase [Candidatus Thorarchaeota archaeon]